MTFKDLKKRVSVLGTTPLEYKTLEVLRDKPFWIWISKNINKRYKQSTEERFAAESLFILDITTVVENDK